MFVGDPEAPDPPAIDEDEVDSSSPVANHGFGSLMPGGDPSCMPELPEPFAEAESV
jgi:hypothetical protein